MDMLVKLYDLPEPWTGLARLEKEGIRIHRILPSDRRLLREFIRLEFPEAPGWADEAETALHRRPLSCFIAVDNGALVGFACYDTTARGFFGPTGTAESHRGRGIATALLKRTLFAMAEEGYGYAAIGWVVSTEFYRKAVGALEIPGSEPGIYRRLLRPQEEQS